MIIERNMDIFGNKILKFVLGYIFLKDKKGPKASVFTCLLKNIHLFCLSSMTLQIRANRLSFELKGNYPFIFAGGLPRG